MGFFPKFHRSTWPGTTLKLCFATQRASFPVIVVPSVSHWICLEHLSWLELPHDYSHPIVLLVIKTKRTSVQIGFLQKKKNMHAFWKFDLFLGVWVIDIFSLPVYLLFFISGFGESSSEIRIENPPRSSAPWTWSNPSLQVGSNVNSSYTGVITPVKPIFLDHLIEGFYL